MWNCNLSFKVQELKEKDTDTGEDMMFTIPFVCIKDADND